MSSTLAPALTAPATVELTAPVRRNRVVALVLAFAVALVLMAAPQLTNSASAAKPMAAPSWANKTAFKWAESMLSVMNAERKAHHLKPLVLNWRLDLSAHRHNLVMAKRNEMSHQLPGEAFFADRISKVGYNWMSAGENIGWNSAMTDGGLNALQREMYNEKAPNNGHRLNILNRSFRQVGIDVYFDKSHKKMWFTQDFGQPA